MARGFLSGALWGAAVSLGVVGVVSVVAPPPGDEQVALVPEPVTEETAGGGPSGESVPQAAQTPVPLDAPTETSTTAPTAEADAPTPAAAPSPVAPPTSAETAAIDVPTPAAPQLARAPDALQGAAPAQTDAPVIAGDDGTARPAAAAAPATAAPSADALPDVEERALALSTPPETSAPDPLAAPQPGTTGDLVTARDAPVFPNPQALAPMAPQPADGIAIVTAPAAPPADDAESAALAEAEAEMPQLPAQPEAPLDTADEAAAPAQTAQAAEEDAPVTPRVPVAQAPDSAPETDAEGAQVAMAAPVATVQIGRPAISLTDRAGSVTIRRPATQVVQPEPQGEATPQSDAPVGGAPAPAGRPITQFGQSFDNPENKPLMSIILIDNGQGPVAGAPGVAALGSFPYALSFAVDASLPDAAERMALYRNEGFEVLAMIDLPEGSQPTDAETNLNVILANMPEVIGILEGTETGLQSARDVSDQVSSILAQTGHGLVTQSRGLNTMPKLARKEGVPADPIFRDFDSKNQTATVIRRFLDQAAFKAGQEGAVIMLGRLRADTISALLLWGLQDRAGQVALAPISAVLLRDVP